MIAIIICSFCMVSQMSAQQFSTKFGKVTDDEVSMTTYAPDTAANAVILFKNGTTMYDLLANDFKITYVVETKIKVLKSEGTEYANIQIPYYSNERNPQTKEIVSQIEAIAYNMENGQVVKTKMKKEYIFRERLSDKYMQVKFSIPSVKAGTVIEYKYKIQSDFYYQLKDWEIQDEIPVMSSNYDITIPEYFKFNFEMRGASSIKTDRKEVPMSLSAGGQVIRCNASNITFQANDIPALKGDDYIWCPDDYKSQIIFELSALDFGAGGYRSFTTSWEKIDELLLEDEDFGKLLKMKNPLQDEMNALNISSLSTDQKIAVLFRFLKSKISWNEKYGLYGMDIKKSIKSGTANNAELNFILISMLREAGIRAYPVVLSRRNLGIIPYTHPSINKINTFVVGIENSDSTRVYLDGSVEDGFINTLPPVLLTDRARIISTTKGDKWVDLSAIGRNIFRSTINATIDSEGNIKGDRSISAMGQNAANYRSHFKAAKDSTEYIEKREEKFDIKMLSYSQEGMRAFSPEVKESFTFTKASSASGDFLYINPIIFAHIDENPFIQEKRQLPVDFSYPYSVRMANVFIIPEGYQIEELPKSQMLKMDNKGGDCTYRVVGSGNRIQVSYVFNIYRTLFTSEEYPMLKNFWGAISDKSSEMIVLKKTAQ